MIELPSYAHLDRGLGRGRHLYLALLPHVRESPALERVAPDPRVRTRLLAEARVLVNGHRGFAYVDVDARHIVLAHRYYRSGSDIDLYLDLIHELTHLRQLEQGHDLWDESFEYVDRPTEVEAYAVAVEEGRRLGMAPADILAHLSNPWMTQSDVLRLVDNVEAFLARGQTDGALATRGEHV